MKARLRDLPSSGTRGGAPGSSRPGKCLRQHLWTSCRAARCRPSSSVARKALKLSGSSTSASCGDGLLFGRGGRGLTREPFGAAMGVKVEKRETSSEDWMRRRTTKPYLYTRLTGLGEVEESTTSRQSRACRLSANATTREKDWRTPRQFTAGVSAGTQSRSWLRRVRHCARR